MSDIRRVEKGWGHELIFADEPLYCGKILHFVAGEKTSMHFHAEKVETFFVLSGEFIIHTINTRDASRTETSLFPGSKMDISRLLPHQIVSIDGGDIVEVSTHDEVNDSYRVEDGSSQRITKTERAPQNLINNQPSGMQQTIFEEESYCGEVPTISDMDRNYHLFEY